MSIDDMKELWQSQEPRDRPRMSDDEILAFVTRGAAELDRRVRRRDRLEIIAAVVVCLVFLPLLWGSPWLTRAGVLLFIAGSAATWLKLRAARRTTATVDPGAPLVARIAAEREAVGAQVRLLESVLWWYIAPLGLGVILIFTGLAGFNVLSLGYTTAVVLLSVWIFHYNRAAARRELRPRYERLSHLLHEVEE